jgi:hypothetical protein
MPLFIYLKLYILDFNNYLKMKKILIKLTVFWGLISVIVSCTKINDVITPSDKPVIEAYLAPNHSVSMRVFTEIPYTSTDSAFSAPLIGLNIKITGSDGKFFTLKGDEAGNYVSAKNEVLGKAGTTYSMSFSYKGRTISASTILPIKPEGFKIGVTTIERVARDLSQGGGPGGGGPGGQVGLLETRTPITLSWNNPDNVYYFVAAQSLETNPIPVVTRPTNNNNGNDRGPQRRFNNAPIQGTSNNLQPQSFEFFGKYAVILYRLNADYAALYVNNSTTSQNISTPVSTIENGNGIFTGVNADTLVLNVKRIQ